MEFLLLQNLVTPNYSAVKYHLPHTGFSELQLTKNLNDYLEYRENIINLIQARGQRMLEAMSTDLITDN